MSNASKPFDFSQFVPGFDFLKNLAGGAAAGAGAGSVPGIPSLASWVAPTLSVEEVDKRIQELKTVQYWLEQNGHALKATIQALEVQKMTLVDLARHERAHGRHRQRVHQAGGGDGSRGRAGTGSRSRGAKARARARRDRGRRRRGTRGSRAGIEEAARQAGLRRREGRWCCWRGRSDAVVGLAHRAVPADRLFRIAGRGAAEGAGNGPAAGRRGRQGDGQAGCRKEGRRRIHFQVRRFQVRCFGRSAARKAPAAGKKTATAARKRTSGRR
jgi:hypothetical protein